jgi:hypothetical protein
MYLGLRLGLLLPGSGLSLPGFGGAGSGAAGPTFLREGGVRGKYTAVEDGMAPGRRNQSSEARAKRSLFRLPPDIG